MNRTQKKCLIISAILHGTLLLLLLVGSAFGPKDTVMDMPVITIFDLNRVRLTDGPTRGGGSPPAGAAALPQPPSQPSQPRPNPPSQPPQPQPVRNEAVVQPRETSARRTQEEFALAVRPNGELPSGKRNTGSSERSGPKVPTNLVSRTKGSSGATSRTANSNQTSANSQLASRFSDAISGLRTGLSIGGVQVDMVGGGGGEGSVNYAQYIMTCFEKAWNPPSELENDEALVETQVVIQRNGRFLLKKITKRCGIPALDKSVERALDAVPFVRPFPEGAQDLERTFNIEFNLKAKRRIG